MERKTFERALHSWPDWHDSIERSRKHLGFNVRWPINIRRGLIKKRYPEIREQAEAELKRLDLPPTLREYWEDCFYSNYRARDSKIDYREITRFLSKRKSLPHLPCDHGVVWYEEEVESHALGSEPEVEQKCRDIFSNENCLIIYDASPADMNRMRLVSNVAKECGRTLVLDSKKAYPSLYMNHPEVLCPGLPVQGEFRVALSRLKLNASRYGKFGLPQDLYAESYTDYRQAHEGKLLVSQRDKQKENPELICLPDEIFIWGPLREEVLQEPGRYLLYTSSGAHTLLHFLPFDGRTVPGTYIYGKAEPFKEEMELSFRRLLKWIELCGLKLEYAHTSGHMYPRDIERLVSEISPQVTIPIHTEHPELFSNWTRNSRIPLLGETINF